jgi:hypothetical protein
MIHSAVGAFWVSFIRTTNPDLCPVLRASEVTIPLRNIRGAGDPYALKLVLVVMDVPLDGATIELPGHRA